MELQVNGSSKIKCISPFLYHFEGKRTEYKSCPYHSIKAFSVETAGSIDADVELKIYGAGTDVTIDFDKKKVDIFQVQKYIGGHVFADSTDDSLIYSDSPSKVCYIHITVISYYVVI